MNSRIFSHLYALSERLIRGVAYFALIFLLIQTCFFYFKDMSYQAVVLNQAWQNAFKEQCRAVPGCLEVKFVSNDTKPAKAASRFAFIGTHLTAQLTVAHETKTNVLEQMQGKLGGSSAEHVDIEVVRIVRTGKRG